MLQIKNYVFFLFGNDLLDFLHGVVNVVLPPLWTMVLHPLWTILNSNFLSNTIGALIGSLLAFYFGIKLHDLTLKKEKKNESVNSIIAVLDFIDTFPSVLDDRTRADQSEGFKNDFFIDEYIDQVENFNQRFNQHITKLHAVIAELGVILGSHKKGISYKELKTLGETEIYAKFYLNRLRRSLRKIKREIDHTSGEGLIHNIRRIRIFNSRLQVEK